MGEKKSGYMDTRGAFIDAAFALFGERGFENTSVDAIVAKARLSKGTFFHYFPTKEALLDAACERLAGEGWVAVKDSLQGRGDPLEKLARYLAEGRRFRAENAAQVASFWEALEHEQNAKLRARVREGYRTRVGPALTQVVASGVATEQFKVEDPATTTELLLEMVDASSEGTMRLLRAGGPEAVEKAKRRVNATLTAVERILGLPPAVLERVGTQILERLQKQPTPGPAGAGTQTPGRKP